MAESIEYLNPIFIDAHNLPDAWFQLQKKLWEIDAYEYPVEWGSYPGQLRREFDFACCRIKHPGLRPLCDEIPPGLSISPPTTIDRIEEYFQTYILGPGKEDNQKYSYGERICIQVEHLINSFREQGFGHVKSCIEIARPEDLVDGKSQPCLRLIDSKIRKDRIANVYRLHFIVYFRVWDLWGGFPENLGGLQLFKEWLVDQIGPNPKDGLPLEDGEMIVMSKSLNVREHMFEHSKARVYQGNKP